MIDGVGEVSEKSSQEQFQDILALAHEKPLQNS
jgi:hypothetical protein